MDPFSHLLLGYLLGFGLWGPNGLKFVVAAAVGGALPDADIALYPLSRRFPLLGHRGISHSIVGVTIIAAVGGFVVPPLMAWGLGGGFSNGPVWMFVVALEVGGLSHVFLDSLDHWSVPIFAPFSPTEYKFDVDRIVNVGSMAFTVIAYGLLIYERGRVSESLWTLTTDLLLAAALLYFLVRILGRWRAGVAQHAAGYTAVIPQGNPLAFVFFREARTGNDRSLQYVRYHLRRGLEEPPRSLVTAFPLASALPVPDLAGALARSYAPAFAASWILGETHPFAEARSVSGGFEVFWYSLEMSFWGRAAGVLAHVDSLTGVVTTRNRWRSPEKAFV
ncbi:MAG: metal-dependent hydrolase [Thermoplasmata archaeon]|nr:metal-dependent hydrolase [Thermoplasmata archaeon]